MEIWRVIHKNFYKIITVYTWILTIPLKFSISIIPKQHFCLKIYFYALLQISAHIEKHGYLPGGLKVFVKFHICSSKSQPGLACSILAEIQRGSTLEGGHIFAASLFVSQGRSFSLPAKFLGVLLGATTQLNSDITWINTKTTICTAYGWNTTFDKI